MPDASSSSISIQEEEDLQNNNLSSADNDDSSSDCDDEMIQSLRSSSTTIGISNSRGRSRQRSNRRKGERRGLRTKFQIESLYVEISELKKQNEALMKIWKNVQQTSQTQESLSRLCLEPQSKCTKITQHRKVPSSVHVSDSSDTGGHGSDLEVSSSDRECEIGRKDRGRVVGDRKYDYTVSETESEMQMENLEHELLYS